MIFKRIVGPKGKIPPLTSVITIGINKSNRHVASSEFINSVYIDFGDMYPSLHLDLGSNFSKVCRYRGKVEPNLRKLRIRW